MHGEAGSYSLWESGVGIEGVFIDFTQVRVRWHLVQLNAWGALQPP